MIYHPTLDRWLSPQDPFRRVPDPKGKTNGKANGKSRYHGVSLMIDDSEEDATLLKAAFARVNAPSELRWVDGQEKAMAYFQARPPFQDRARNPIPSLVFLDIQLPVHDGYSILGWLRSQPDAWRLVPVIMLTTSNDVGEVRRAYDMGANSFLVKPTGFDELCRLVKTASDYWLKDNKPG